MKNSGKQNLPLTKKQKTLKILSITLITILSVLILTVGTFAVWFKIKWDNAQAPSNEKDDTKVFDENTDDVVTLDTSLVNPDFPLPDSIKNNTGDTNININKDEMFNFLFVGKDRVAENTDVILLISYNVKEKNISLMHIPRDTYIKYNNVGHKINSMYSIFLREAKNNKADDPEIYALERFAETLEKNICINIHYTAMINLEGFRNIVDILGGVEIDIPYDINYYDDSKTLIASFKKGKQVLNGEMSEYFIRYRAGYLQADIGRIDAQKIFISALLRSVTNNFNASTIVQLATQVFKYVETDLKLEELMYFAKNLLEVDLSNMLFLTMPGYSPTPPNGGAWYYVMNRWGMLNVVNTYFNIYDENVTDIVFDKYKIFTSTTDASYLNPYYICDPAYVIGGKPQSAGDINQDSIDIPKA